MVEVRISDLDGVELQRFVDVHGIGDLMSKNKNSGYSLYGKGKVPVGWYNKNSLRVAFYYNPSFFSKQKMYWLYGWSWESNGKT
jgi:hypothetical protein